jgi:hypothetical protein
LNSEGIAGLYFGEIVFSQQVDMAARKPSNRRQWSGTWLPVDPATPKASPRLKLPMLSTSANAPFFDTLRQEERATPPAQAL